VTALGENTGLSCVNSDYYVWLLLATVECSADCLRTVDLRSNPRRNDSNIRCATTQVDAMWPTNGDYRLNRRCSRKTRVKPWLLGMALGPLACLPLIRSARLYSDPYMRLEPNVSRAACNSAKIFPRHIGERFSGAAYSPKTVPWEPRGGDSSPPDGVSLGAGVAQPRDRVVCVTLSGPDIWS
jgi:hypothetical protein